MVEGAPFLLFCHDDVALDPSAVRILVEEAYRSNAAILGPKLVSADNPEVLLEVGRAIDRFGAPYTGIEPGEIDQEQHDGVRDVFYVPTATMLVRTDLFTELEGFDPETFPGAEDLDLCWRARLAGARVLVVPDARVAHHEASGARARADRPNESAIVHSRVRAAAHLLLVRQAALARAARHHRQLLRVLRQPGHRSSSPGPGRDRRLVVEPVAPRIGAQGPQSVRRRTARCTTPTCASCRSARSHGVTRVARPPPPHRGTPARARRREPQRGRLRVRRHAGAGHVCVPRVPRPGVPRVARPVQPRCAADRHLRRLAVDRVRVRRLRLRLALHRSRLRVGAAAGVPRRSAASAPCSSVRSASPARCSWCSRSRSARSACTACRGGSSCCAAPRSRRRSRTA